MKNSNMAHNFFTLVLQNIHAMQVDAYLFLLTFYDIKLTDWRLEFVSLAEWCILTIFKKFMIIFLAQI